MPRNIEANTINYRLLITVYPFFTVFFNHLFLIFLMTWNTIYLGRNMTILFLSSSWVGTQKEILAESFSLVCIGCGTGKVSSELLLKCFL